MELQGVDLRPAVVSFDGGHLSSDGGAMLVGQLDRRPGVTSRLSECFEDHRNPHFFVRYSKTLRRCAISHLGQNVKKMAEFRQKRTGIQGRKRRPASNVKESHAYERFGEAIRYMTIEEWQRFLSQIDHYDHKLMMRVIYELGCRVGEFVQIQLAHVDFQRGRVFFPRENTKTGHRRVSHLPQGLKNELKSWLKQNRRMTVRQESVKCPVQFLFSPRKGRRRSYTENRLRQIFRRYVQKGSLDRAYGTDRLGRVLHELAVHSLRHSHIMHYIHIHKLPIAVVQKQVGHTSLKTTSVYLNPSEEAVASAYDEAAQNTASGTYR